MLVSAARGFELWADSWDTTPSPLVALEERLMRPWFECLSARRPVDIGCGTGRWAARLNAIGLDLSQAMLAVASRKPGLGGRLAVADASMLPLPAECADLVLCTLTLGHVPDPYAAWRELIRILQPGGVLVLTDFHPAAAARGWRRTFRHEGQVYELGHYPYSIGQLTGLTLREYQDGTIGEPERSLFIQAGRPELFVSACQAPAIFVSRWVRE